MLGFAPVSDFSVSDIGGDTTGEMAFPAEVTLTIEGSTDDPWSCQSGAAATWTCQ